MYAGSGGTAARPASSLGRCQGPPADALETASGDPHGLPSARGRSNLDASLDKTFQIARAAKSGRNLIANDLHEISLPPSLSIRVRESEQGNPVTPVIETWEIAC